MNLHEQNIAAIDTINTLAKELQQYDARVYYISRIIEFLTDIARVANTDSSIKRLLDYVDSSDKNKYRKIFGMMMVEDL